MKPAGALPQRQPNSRQRILVVEDDRDILRLNTDALTHFGYHVDAAEDGAVAWEKLQLQNYDLMITDNIMPNVSGVELLQKLHAARMTLPVIMATGKLPQEDLDPSSHLRIHSILPKPYTGDELLVMVKGVLRAATDASGGIAPAPNWL